MAQAEAHFMYRLQTVGGFGGKSDQLNAYNVLKGTPGFFAADLERYRSATRESIQAAARRYLQFDQRRRPERDSARAARAGARRFHGGIRLVTRIDRSRLPDVGADPRFSFPAIVRHTLRNGLRVCTIEHHSVPVITFSVQVDGGSGADPEGLEGLAAVVADMADEGTGAMTRDRGV